MSKIECFKCSNKYQYTKGLSCPKCMPEFASEDCTCSTLMIFSNATEYTVLRKPNDDCKIHGEKKCKDS